MKSDNIDVKMLSERQKEIILERYNNKEPLNITELLRVMPDVIKTCFSGEKPWGWRKTLLDLNIDPYQIESSYTESVECRVCGVKMQNLGSHILNKHGYSKGEYQKKFPDAELSSERFRINKFTGKTYRGIEHWDCFWNPYYFLDYLLAVHEKGYPLNSEAIRAEMGILDYAITVFGSWDQTLGKIGLVSERKSKPGKRWNRQMVIDSLKKLSELRKSESSYPASEALQLAAKRHFGSMPKAVAAAGLEPDEFYIKVPSLDESQIPQMLKDFESLKNLMGIERKRKLLMYQEKYMRILRVRFDSMAKLALGQGWPQESVSLSSYRHEQDVHHDLDELENNGVRLTYAELKKRNVTLHGVILNKGWGRKRILKKETIPRYPKCDPRSGKLCDRLIVWRRRLKVTRSKAAKLLEISTSKYAAFELDQTKAGSEVLRKIQEEFEKSKLPYKVI